MGLWTIIDGDIYLERDPWYRLKPSGDGYITYWYDVLSKVSKHPNFPKKIQFWTRQFSDRFYQPEGKRWDIDHPHIWFDNHKDQNVLVVPDAYMYIMWNHKKDEREHMFRNLAEEGYFHQDKFNWENKKS